ncbi:MAG TPA: hypothetical protein PK224_09680 [Nitrospira sp.]|nr:hypothetical protein [Nitrospira sp.]
MERFGQVLIACCLIAALLGLFGHHPLASVTQQTADGGLSIHYDRFARLEKSGDIGVTVEPLKDRDGVVRVWLDQEYLDASKLTSISPTPIRVEARNGGRVFVFQSDGSRFTATLSVQLDAVGTVHGSVRVDDGEPLSVTQFVWP